MLCDDLEDGMEQGTGRETQEEMYVYLKLTHIVVQQKSTQHGKAIIFQFKIIWKKHKKESDFYTGWNGQLLEDSVPGSEIT